jgi:predicted DNA-binding transcriptional regulator AlpA
MDAITPRHYPPGAMVRVAQICGNPEKGIPGLLPIAPTTWWKWVKAGRVPAGRKLSPKTTVWPIEAVLAFGGSAPKPVQR